MREISANVTLSSKNQMIAVIIIMSLCITCIAQAGNEASAIRNTNAVFSNVAQSPAATNFSTYSDPSNGIKFIYPTSWLPVSQSIGNSIVVITFISPQQNKTNYATSISVSAEKLSNKTTLEEFSKFTDNLLNSTANKYKVLKSQKITLAGNPSIEKVMTMRMGVPTKQLSLIKVNLKGIQIYSIIGNRVYTLSIVAELSRFNNFLPIFDRIANSLEFINQTRVGEPPSTNNQTSTDKQTSTNKQIPMIQSISAVSKDKSLVFSYIGYSSNRHQVNSLYRDPQFNTEAKLLNGLERVSGGVAILSTAALALLQLSGYITAAANPITFGILIGGGAWFGLCSYVCSWILPAISGNPSDGECPMIPLVGPGSYEECEMIKVQQLNAQYCQSFEPEYRHLDPACR